MSSFTSSTSRSEAFTLTHARHISAKVITDLKRIQRFYGVPSDKWIQDYEAELIAHLKAGYLEKVTYGFRRENQWIEPTLKYSARDLLDGTSSDDDPGRIRADAKIGDAVFWSYLTRNTTWTGLSADAQEAFEKELPFRRVGAAEPSVNGYFQQERTYSAGGKALDRYSVKSFS